MYKQIVIDTMQDMVKDTTYIRISTATSFIHALIFNILILYYLIGYSEIFASNTILGRLIHDYLDLVSFDSSMLVWIIILVIFLLIGYELLPPIGEGAQIFYLDQSPPKDGFRAFAQGLYKFFPLFEFGVATGFFKISFLILILTRLRLFDLISNPLIIIVMSLWVSVSFFFYMFLSYSKVIICLDNKGFFEAMKESMHISVQNFDLTLKFVLVNFALSIRFFINLFIIISIPVGIIYLGARIGLDNILFMKYLFLIILIFLVFLAAYIEGIIEGFFSAAWWRIYKTISKPTVEASPPPLYEPTPTTYVSTYETVNHASPEHENSL